MQISKSSGPVQLCLISVVCSKHFVWNYSLFVNLIHMKYYKNTLRNISVIRKECY